jgi:hypothetical protein
MDLRDSLIGRRYRLGGAEGDLEQVLQGPLPDGGVYVDPLLEVAPGWGRNDPARDIDAVRATAAGAIGEGEPTGQRLAVLQYKTVRQTQTIADDGAVISGLGARLCAPHRLWLCGGVLCDDTACASSEDEHEVVDGSQGEDRFGVDGGWYGLMLPNVPHGCQEGRGKPTLFFSHADVAIRYVCVATRHDFAL